MSAGGANSGAASSTVMVKVCVVGMPDEFVAVHERVVMPMTNVEPELGEQVTGTVPSLKSVALGVVYVATAPAELVAVSV